MVVDQLDAHAPHDPVERLCRNAFEKRVAVALLAYTVNDVVAFMVGVDHLLDDIDVVLQIRIDADDDVRVYA